MSRTPEPRAAIAHEVDLLIYDDRDSFGRSLAMIGRQRALALELEQSQRRALRCLDASEIEVGREAGGGPGSKLRKRLEANALAFARMAERDRQLLARVEAWPTPAAEEGAGGTPAPRGEKPSESRSGSAIQFSSPRASSPSVQELLDHCAGAPDTVLERLREQAEGLTEPELAAFLDAVPWQDERRAHWALLRAEQRAGWLVEELAAVRSDLEEHGLSAALETGSRAVALPQAGDQA